MPALDVVAFRTLDVLGGASIVVPAGTAVRVPAGSLDFSGFDTLSLKMLVAGLVGADDLVVAVDTVDPQSATADTLPGALGRVDVVTAAANGNVAGTLYLHKVLGGGSTPSVLYLPNSDITPVGTQWSTYSGPGGNPAIYPTTWQCVGLNDDYDAYAARDCLLPGAYNYNLGLNGVLPADVPGWNAIFRITNLFGIPVADAHFQMSLVTDDGTTWACAGVASDLLTGAWETFVQPMVITATGSPNHNSERITLITPGRAGYIAATYAAVQSVASSTGITEKSIPFYRNTLLLDATGSTHDVTVSNLFAELTRARRQ